MNSKFQPSEDKFDDVEGHAARGKALLPEENADVEGHGRGTPAAPDADEDTEGQLMKGRALPEDDDEAEGHGRFNV